MKPRCTIAGCRFPNNHETRTHVEYNASTPNPRVAALLDALKSIANGNNDTCAFDPVMCPDCSCPSCKAQNALEAWARSK